VATWLVVLSELRDFMGFYRQVIFPRLCDLLLNRPLVAQYRRELLAEAYGDVLEIGFGTGLNLPFYPQDVRKLTTVDPNAGMHSLARKRIKQSGIEVDRRVLSGERLPFANDSFDCVVSTFTLCSIDGVGQALGEVYRVLKPGAHFLFLDHGLSPDPTICKWQRRLNWLEMRLADGCRLDRDIGRIVAAQPFSSLAMDQFYMGRFPKTHGYVSRGVATK
jgi:ubiquinone/menaquinone biosynthesis C-methylase UbiE